MSVSYDQNRNHFAPQEELEELKVKIYFSEDNIATLYFGDCLDFLRQIPNTLIQIIDECIRVLKEVGFSGIGG